MKKVFLTFLVLTFSFLTAFVSQAQSASFYLAPSRGTFFVDSTFDVSVFVNTGGEDVNAVQVDLKFDPKKLQITNPTAGKSFIEVWVSQPSYSNTNGSMSFIGGVPTPGINTSAGLVSTITFRAISPGETTVLFLPSSKVLLNDSEGTNILSSMSRGVYNLIIAPPEGPKVFSPTHPDVNKWYKNNNPTFSWEKEEGVTDFSYSFDQDSTGVPDNNSEGSHTSVSFSSMEDGIWYFHVKSKKSEVWGGVSHYLVRIDTTPPASFPLTVRPSAKTTEKQPLIFFITTDAFSEIDYYRIKHIDITPERKEEATGFFAEATSPYRLNPLEIGKYLVVVRAYDKAGNYREGTVNIQIFPEGISITKRGIQFREFLIPWWILILVLIILIIIIIFIGFRFWKKNRSVFLSERISLKKRKERIEDQRKKMLSDRNK